MSSGAERLLVQMLNPNPHLRCSAAEALADGYWSGTSKNEPIIVPRVKVTTSDQSLVSETSSRAKVTRLPSVIGFTSPRATRIPHRSRHDKENIPAPAASDERYLAAGTGSDAEKPKPRTVAFASSSQGRVPMLKRMHFTLFIANTGN
jgi:hypothetical protein